MIKLIKNTANTIKLDVSSIMPIDGFFARLSLNSKTYTVSDLTKNNLSVKIPKADVVDIGARGKGLEGFLRAYNQQEEKQLELRIWFRVCDTAREADGFQTLYLQFTDTGEHTGEDDDGGGGGGGSSEPVVVTAADVTYDNADYPTVKAALDKLLYVSPAINSFNGGGSYENGKSIATVNFSWSLNKTVTSQSITDVGIVGASARSYSYTPASPITSNKTFTLTVGDGTKTATRSTSISFYNKIYWGVSANAELTNADVLAFETAGNAAFASSRAITKTFNCSGGKYFYFAIPTSFCNGLKMVVGGLSFSAFTFVTKADFVNASGKTVSYNIYRPNSIQNGSSITVEVK